MEDDFDLTPDVLETAIADMDKDLIDDYSDNMNYESFVVLNKRDLLNFCRVVEPLAKATIDDYGKSVFITSLDKDQVELRYFNKPHIVAVKVANKSGKTIRPFTILISTLKKLVINAYSSLVFVDENDEINVALCESLLYLETKPLQESLYKFSRSNPTNLMDKELSVYTFKKIGSMLSCSDRAAEKIIVVKNNWCNFNTGYFSAKSKSPFGVSPDFIVYKAVADVLGILAEISKVDLKYELIENKLILCCDGAIYCELPISGSDKVSEFYSPSMEHALGFNADIVVLNDSLLRLIQVVKSLDYLSDIVTLEFNKVPELLFTINTTNQTKPSVYKFSVLEGTPDRIGDMKVSVEILKNFFEVAGSDIKYAFTEEGLGLKNDVGVFIIRRA